MGKKRGGGGGGGGGGGTLGYGMNKKPPPTSGLLQHGKSQPASLRQQSGRGGAAATTPQTLNPGQQAAALRADHLLRIATWASANVPPLGALIGARLGSLCEAAGVPVPQTSHSICQSCESVLQVGVNCSVRVAKNKRKGKSSISNYVTHICHFCKHGNAKPGTVKKHVKTKIAQAAARSNLKFLGASLASETDKPTLPQGPPVEEILLQKQQQQQQESSAPEAVETTLDKERPSGQEGAEAPSGLMKTSQQGQEEASETVEMEIIAEQDDAKVALDMEPLNITESIQPEQEAAMILDQPLKNQPDQESPVISLIEEPVDLKRPEQESAVIALIEEPVELKRPEQESAEAVVGTTETTPQECPEETVQDKGLEERTVKNEQEGVKPTLNRLPLDLSSKKKRKKKNQQQVVGEQENPHKGLVVESNDNAKKKKRKGWSSLKELVPFP